jgi:hypothetical protein
MVDSKKVTVLCAIVLLVGCATDQALVQKQIDAALKERPLVSIQCPETGCVMTSFTVNNPNQIKLPHVTNGWDTATTLGTSLLRVVDRAGTMYLVTETVKEGFKYIRSNDNSITTTTTTTTEGSNNVSTNETNSESIADSYNSSETSESVADSYNSNASTTESTSNITDTVTTTSTTDTTSTNTPTITGDNNTVN